MGAMISGGGWSAAGEGLKSAGQSILQYYKMKIDEQDRQDRLKQEATQNALREKTLAAEAKRAEAEAKRWEEQAKNDAYDRYAGVLSRLPAGAQVGGEYAQGAIGAGFGPFMNPEIDTNIVENEVAPEVTDVERNALKAALERDNIGLPKGQRTDIGAVLSGDLQSGMIPGVTLGETGPTGNYTVDWGLTAKEKAELQNYEDERRNRAFNERNILEDNRRANESLRIQRENQAAIRSEAFDRDSQNLVNRAQRQGLATWRAEFPRQSGSSQDELIASLIGTTDGMPSKVDPAVAYSKLRQHMRAALETQVKTLRQGGRLAQFYTPEQIEALLDTITPGAVEDLREEERQKRYIDSLKPPVDTGTTRAAPKAVNPWLPPS